MELNGKSLETWLEESKSGYSLHGKFIDFYSVYVALKKFLLPKQEETTKGAILSEIEIRINAIKEKLDEKRANSETIDPKDEALQFHYEKLKWLNDHGPRHIDCVIERASQLCDKRELQLIPREVYCLLSAIQLHDIGNFYGRSGHEEKISQVVKEGQTHIGSDQVERKYIVQIASVHGGTVKGTANKDTISQLKISTPILNDQIRLRLLASLVRFADELADEQSRADIQLLIEGKLPKCSEVYHAYSASLHSVLVKHATDSVELHFYISKAFLERKFGKDNGETYLIDEIYERTMKMHLERQYCSRFWKGFLNIECIAVSINFYSESVEEDVHPEITYTLRDSGYPKQHHDIYELCPTLMNNGVKMDGDYFKAKVTENGQQQPV